MGTLNSKTSLKTLVHGALYCTQEGTPNEMYNFLAADGRVDCFCPSCEQDTVITGGELHVGMHWTQYPQETESVYTKEFCCSRDSTHKFFFSFHVLNGRVITKIGQIPSKADLDEAHVKQYKKVLQNEDFRELSKAVGLAAHGVGIGSFVYLRRIFERLIESAATDARKLIAWDETAYARCRMGEKIQLLKAHLPEVLVSHSSLYSVLSKGIHELSEAECLANFEIVRTGIELILDQKLHAAIQLEKTKAFSTSLAAITSRPPSSIVS